MKEKTYFLNTVLALVIFAAMLVVLLLRTFCPNVIMPIADIPNLVLVSLAALLIDRYLAPGAMRCYICIPVFSFISFALLPFCAGMTAAAEALKLGILGAAVFTATTWLFSSIEDRLSTGPAAKLAPFVGAVGLYLASQCFMGL